MFGEMLDTSPKQRARYYELLRNQTPQQRLRTLEMMSAGVRDLAEAGIRREHPEASDSEIKVRLTVRLYGREVGRRLHGAITDDAR